MWLWALLPICLAVFGTVGIWTVLVMNLMLDDLFFPSPISTCGSYNPQSCLFSQICNTSSVLGLWIVVIRFQQVRDFGNHGWVNTASIVFGFISCVGLSILGNFQVSSILEIHVFGALLAFFVGLAYFWVQLILTYRAEPSQDRCWVGPVRATCCTICTILAFASILSSCLYPSPAAVCEWTLVMLFFCLFGLFAVEFKHIDCHRLTVQKRALETDCFSASIFNNTRVILTSDLNIFK
uniref:CWH43-like N-terminal domain-containing protein n=1 Tax=Anabas testudineus TaxID=64144 RepID=A0A3Q1HMQ6_ANATE